MSTSTVSSRLSFLERALGRIVASKSGREASARCPFASCPSRSDTKKLKLAIRVTDFFNHCWVCGWRARSLLPLIRKFASHLESEYVANHWSPLHDELAPSQLTPLVALPDSCVPICQLPSWHRAMKYCDSRGLTERDLWRWRLMWVERGENKDRILFPSFDSTGDLNFWVARAAGEWRPKYANPNVPANTIVFGEIDVDLRSEIVLCEGPFDAVKCGDASVPMLGSVFDESHALFDAIVKNRTSVVLMLDADASSKALRIARLLSEYDVRVKIGTSDPDPGSMTHASCAEAILAAREYSWESALKMKMEMKLR